MQRVNRHTHSSFCCLALSLVHILILVEFPAVLLNTSSGEIESEFHHYVQPQEQPTLSAFCTELTGITQVRVARAGEFHNLQK